MKVNPAQKEEIPPGRCRVNGIYRLMFLIPLLTLLCSCASLGILSGFTSGEPKNSLPFIEKGLIEEVNTVAVPPFYGDRHNWRLITQEILSSDKRISVIPAKKIDGAFKSIKKDLASVGVDERSGFLSNTGRLVQSDAVINGVILDKDKRYELILQLVSSEDSRVLWWQAVEFSFREGHLSASDQKSLLSKILSPLLIYMGKRDKPPAIISPPVHPKTEIQPKTGTKPDKDSPPLPSPADISPM
ncbi:MAG: hypothetical protein AB1632_00255 [Nitrospirota bacterium]